MKKIFILFIMTSLFIACNQKEKLYDQVMDVHDEAMGKMDKIMNLKSQLKEKIQTMELDTLNDHSAEINEMEDLVQQLDAADESMMNWMREFHSDYETKTRNEVLDYLENQKEKITTIGREMNKAVAEAEEYLESETTI